MDLMKKICETKRIRKLGNTRQWNLNMSDEGKAIIEDMCGRLKKETNDSKLKRDICPSLIIETLMRSCYENFLHLLKDKEVEK